MPGMENILDVIDRLEYTEEKMNKLEDVKCLQMKQREKK